MAGAALAAGCADNAILEVTLDLPPSGALVVDGGVVDAGPMPARRYAFVQIRRAAEFDHAVAWSGTDPETIELDPTERTIADYSVVSTDEATDVHVKVQFCVHPQCISPEDMAVPSAPAVWYALEHPFYIGKRTFWDARIDVIPGPASPTMEVLQVGKCEIEGCISGVTDDFCRIDGRHWCEE